MTPKQGGRTPFPPHATRAFEHLRPLIADRGAGMPVADACQRVCSAGEDPAAVDELLNKGYLYEVEGDVFVTRALSRRPDRTRKRTTEPDAMKYEAAPTATRSRESGATIL